MAELGFEPEPLGSPRDSPPTPWFVPSLLFTSLPPSSAQASGHGVGQGRNQPPGACSLLWGQTRTRLAPTEADTKGWSAQRMAVQGPRPLGLRPGWDPNSQLLQSQGMLLAPPLHSSLGVPGTPRLPTRPALQVKRGWQHSWKWGARCGRSAAARGGSQTGFGGRAADGPAGGTAYSQPLGCHHLSPSQPHGDLAKFLLGGCRLTLHRRPQTQKRAGKLTLRGGGGGR